MPIYAYKCGTCGFAKDVLQKMSDPPLSVCPSCGAHAFTKQVTAASFQLKGSGWYVTDFRNEGKPGAAAEPASAATGEGNGAAHAGASSAPAGAGADSASAAAPAPAAAAPAPSASPAAAAPPPGGGTPTS